MCWSLVERREEQLTHLEQRPLIINKDLQYVLLVHCCELTQLHSLFQQLGHLAQTLIKHVSLLAKILALVRSLAQLAFQPSLDDLFSYFFDGIDKDLL